MRALQSILLLMLSLAAPATAASVPKCTDLQAEQHDSAWDTLHTICDTILLTFGTCSDECYAHFKSVAAAAPNCSRSGFEHTMPELDQTFVTRCEDGRANMTNKYTPKTQSGLTNCTSKDESAWEVKYGYPSPVNDCVITFMAAKTCSDQCLAMIEEGLGAAKECYYAFGYSSREMKKKDLVGCLQARGEDVNTNTLLQSVGSSQNSTSADKSSSAKAPTTAPSATTASSALGVALSFAVGVGSVVSALLSLE